MIRILRSSAGSGKTFNLAKTYIRQLLLKSGDKYAYRSILAVTFTNKATAEMKNRILKELDILSRNPVKSGYIDEFSKEFGGMQKVQARAAELLKAILHDYSAFAVSTIDRFFQQALRAFARELGQFSSYQIELDKVSLVHESADSLLSSIGSEDESPGVRQWLKQALMDQLSQKEKLSLDSLVRDKAERLISDELREALESRDLTIDDVFSRSTLEKVRNGCRDYISSYKKRVEKAAAAALEAFNAQGKTEDSFKNARWTYAKLKAYAENVSEALENDLTMTFSKFLAEYSELDSLNYLLTGDPAKDYGTALIISSQVYTLGLASELENRFKALMDQKNVISIEESNLTLRNIIDGSDAPFIYEKLGVRFSDFLLDEFQDTSTIQWENFRPLLADSDASGGFNLLVGDVKQSIYRWRGGDWKLLASGVKDNFPGADDSNPLINNWRSLPAIVNFNNEFFKYASAELDRLLGDGNRIKDIYSQAEQIVCCKGDGRVAASIAENHESQFPLVLESVQRAISEGFTYGQIAILVRRNRDGSDVASYLLQNGIPVISDDSMRVKSSVTVRRLIALLACMDNGQNPINHYLTESLGIELPSNYDSIFQLAEDLLSKLRDVDQEMFGKETVYIQSFMDTLLAWYSSNGNSLASFLEYWEGQEPKIASPEGTDSVRVITIHKSKGLEFPYVIVPFAGQDYLFDTSKTTCWSFPDLAGSTLESFASGIYDVSMSSKTAVTRFAGSYKRELVLQYIDSINTFYVALTRAERVLHVITAPSNKKGTIKSMADIFINFLDGNGKEFITENAVVPGPLKKASAEIFPAGYSIYPVRGRMRVGGDAAEYFARGEGDTDLPVRLKGIVMHKILSDVTVASDLPAAVARAVASGLAEPSLADAYLSMLKGKLEEVRSYGWFLVDGCDVLNERDIVGGDGSLNRPDRVIIGQDGAVTVIDYKFGAENPSYAAQVRRYCALFRKMGYSKVSGWLWYVSLSQVVEVR